MKTAQITAALNRSPARPPEIAVRNNSTVNLTAFAISMAPVAHDAADTAVDTDRLAVSSQLPLPPNHQYAVSMPIRFRPGQPAEDLFEPLVPSSGAAEYLRQMRTRQ